MRPDQAPVPAARSPALSNRELSNPPSPAAAPAVPAAPTSRPKLNLQKRTVSEAPSDAAASPAMSDAKPSPFGAAKPIDTATKEKEIEEKRQTATKEKKEADDKAREEKRVSDDKAREEKRSTQEAARAARAERADREPTSPKGKPNGQQQSQSQSQENGVTSPTAGKNYEILRRNADQDMAAADEEADEADAEGTIVDDKGTRVGFLKASFPILRFSSMIVSRPHSFTLAVCPMFHSSACRKMLTSGCVIASGSRQRHE